MTTAAPEEQTSGMTEADEQAFYARVDGLYRVYEDWTGDDDEAATEVPAAERRQKDGSPCIAPHVAISTFAVFTARLAVDYEMSREDFLEALGTMYDNEVEAEEEDGGGSDESAGNSAVLS